MGLACGKKLELEYLILALACKRSGANSAWFLENYNGILRAWRDFPEGYNGILRVRRDCDGLKLFGMISSGFG